MENLLPARAGGCWHSRAPPSFPPVLPGTSNTKQNASQANVLSRISVWFPPKDSDPLYPACAGCSGSAAGEAPLCSQRAALRLPLPRGAPLPPVTLASAAPTPAMPCAPGSRGGGGSAGGHGMTPGRSSIAAPAAGRGQQQVRQLLLAVRAAERSLPVCAPLQRPPPHCRAGNSPRRLSMPGPPQRQRHPSLWPQGFQH